MLVGMTALVAVAGATGCGSDDGAHAGGADAGPYAVATTGIWADIAGMVACDGSFEIRELVPAGGDPHAYEPSLRDREVLDGAALVVANGLGLEESLTDTLEDVAASGVPVIRMAEHTETIPTAAGADDDDHGADPHVWFDPRRVGAALPALGDAFVAAGANRAAIDGCATAARAQLAELDSELEDVLARVPPERRLLVTNHDALGYFADRYGFEILGTVLPSASTLTEASPAQLEALSEAIEAAGVPAIFSETLHASGDADALAARLGVQVVELYTDALGAPGSGAETYPDLLRHDANAVAAALGR
jgi:zinc/manganese transport system substrate-binding protein